MATKGNRNENAQLRKIGIGKIECAEKLFMWFLQAVLNMGMRTATKV